MNDRRAALCAIVAFTFPLLIAHRSSAQSSKPTAIGLLDASDRLEWWDAFRQQLRQFGHIEGRDVRFEMRLAKGELEVLPAMARELVGLKASVFVTSGTNAALAAKRATSTIPIVMATGTDQVSLGLAASLAHPGGNVTGLSTLTSELMAKRFELVHDLIPNVSRIAVLWNTENLSSMASVRDLQSVAERSKVALQTVAITAAQELPGAFSSMTRERAEAVIVVQTPLMYTHRTEIADLAIKNRLPSVWGASEYVVAGGLISYAPSYPELFRRAAGYVQKILKGANPGDLPIEQPSTFELAVNTKTARALGVAIPASMLTRANRIVS